MGGCAAVGGALRCERPPNCCAAEIPTIQKRVRVKGGAALYCREGGGEKRKKIKKVNLQSTEYSTEHLR